MSFAALLADIPAGVTTVADPRGVGFFLTIASEKPVAHLQLAVGKLTAARWMACHRYDPFWMKPTAGKDVAAIPAETQSLVVELADGRVAILVPLLDGAFRCALSANAQGQLVLTADSGDPAVMTSSVTGLFFAVGADLHTLLAESALSVMARMKTGRLRQDKTLPTFADKFGWCTWDAFYQEVSHEKVRQGLESFKRGGIEPRVLILDDGWQSAGEKPPESARRLTAFAANDKFPGDLAPTIAMAKHEFKVENFMVWHAFHGYWGGVDPVVFAALGAKDHDKRWIPAMYDVWKEPAAWGLIGGIIPSAHIHAFYQAYHRHLRAQGVDGVKVDSQSILEAYAPGEGGRVRLYARYHEALEGSVHVHFAGELINCMSQANDIIYQTLNSTILRTSTDFWPNQPETHGLHLYTNAQTCLWFGHFIHGDWDMFQSGHPWGEYHAAGRAVSGAPVYVSDKPGQHNFDLLRKMVCADGTTLRCDNPGVPTHDCVFADVLQEDVLLKIQNTNARGRTGVVGLFNCRYLGENPPAAKIPGHVAPADVAGLAGETFAVYLQRAGTLSVVKRNEKIPVSLGQGEWEIATIVPVTEGVAVLGLADKFNTGGSVQNLRQEPGRIDFLLRDAGTLLVACAKPPKSVSINGTNAAMTWDAGTARFTAPMAGQVRLDW